MGANSDTSMLFLAIGLLGSVSLLLWGSFTVRSAMERSFEVTIRNIVSSAASGSVKAVIGGILTAFMMQSATATILLSTSLMGSGGLSLTAVTAVIIGADLGSALATRLLYLDLSLLSPLLLCVGVGFHLFSQTWRGKYFGRILVGLGMMLLAIILMKHAIEPLISTNLSKEWVSVLLSAPWIALILAAILTWLAHSSVAMVLIIATLAQSRLLPSELIVMMLLGINIGAGVIALPLVSVDKTEARSAILTNILFRTVLAIVGSLLIKVIVDGLPILSSSPGSQVVLFHISFNVLIVALFTPFAGSVTTAINGWMINRQQESVVTSLASAGSGLDFAIIDNPDRALLFARREALRLGEVTETLFSLALSMFDAQDRSEILNLVESDSEINSRNRAIHHYLSEVRRHITNSEQEKKLDKILEFAATMEDIGDIISHNFSRLAVKRLNRGVRFSSDGHEEIELIHKQVLSLLRLEINRFLVNDKNAVSLSEVGALEIKKLCSQSIRRHRKRLSDRKNESIGTSSIHQDMIRGLLQVVSLMESISDDEDA